MKFHYSDLETCSTTTGVVIVTAVLPLPAREVQRKSCWSALDYYTQMHYFDFALPITREDGKFVMHRRKPEMPWRTTFARSSLIPEPGAPACTHLA